MGILTKVIIKPIIASISAILAILCCLRCAGSCRMRDCECIRRFLRWSGHDEFDDSELMVQVQEARFQPQNKKTKVRLIAGQERVESETNNNGQFHQTLHITLEQGTVDLKVQLLDMSDRVLAETRINIVEKIIRPRLLKPDMVFNMTSKSKHISNPSITLTMVIGDDPETGVPGSAQGIDFLLKRQLQKAKEEGSGTSELEILKKACAGPLELFEGLGATRSTYVAVLGPPTTRRWMLGFWDDKRDYEAKRHAFQEVGLLKVQSVQSDPTRHHVFVINYYDDARVRQALTLRRTDRARDVWVEILQTLVQKAHDAHDERKHQKMVRQTDSRSYGPFGSEGSTRGKSSKLR